MAFDIPPIVAVDSMTLVWGIRKEGTEDQRARATWLFAQFTARRTQVIVAGIALAEYLTVVDPAHHEGVIAAFETRYLLRPFTPECAPIAARLFGMGSQMRVKGQPGGRAILRADTLIIATAKIHGAGRIYTNDGDCRDLANAMFPGFAHDLPDPPRDLYGDPLDQA